MYGFDSFCQVLAQILELKLVSPKDALIAQLPNKFLKRNIEIKTISEKHQISFPKFIKPVIPKLFKAEIFQNIESFNSQIIDIESDKEILISDIIKVEKEVRCFILNNEIADLAFYEGAGDIELAQSFINNFLRNAQLDLPKTYVLDIGFNQNEGWFVIEFNSSWGAGLNFCQAEKVIDCIRDATEG